MKYLTPAAKIAATLPGIMLAAAALTGCDRTGISEGQQQIVYSEPGVVIPLPESSDWWAEKWGFDNYLNNTNLNDMIQIRDKAWIGRDYTFWIYPGARMNNGINVFSDTPTKMKIPLEPSWFLSDVKFDSEDVDGANGAEIILTEVQTKGLFEDGYIVRNKVAVYDGKNSYKVVGGPDLEEKVSDFIERCDNMIGEDDTLSDYLAIDWGDMNKDGKADQIFVCDYLNNAEVLVITSAMKPDDAQMSYGPIYTGFIRDFFLARTVHDQDMEDYDYNRAYDIALFYYSGGDKINITFALNSGIQGSTINFYVQPDYQVTIPKGANPGPLGLGIKKIDSFNADMSPYADLVFLGSGDGGQVMVVFPTYIKPLEP